MMFNPNYIYDHNHVLRMKIEDKRFLLTFMCFYKFIL